MNFGFTFRPHLSTPQSLCLCVVCVCACMCCLCSIFFLCVCVCVCCVHGSACALFVCVLCVYVYMYILCMHECTSIIGLEVPFRHVVKGKLLVVTTRWGDDSSKILKCVY